MQSIGKYLIVLGAIIALIGIFITLFPKINFFGKLPGDIEIKRENFTFYFPLVTSILLSLIITGILWLVNYFFRK
jgi:hypothetical protein